jgi:hypothetical protein
MEQHRTFAVRVGAAVLLMALFAGSSSALAGSETPRGGDLVVSKECSGFVNDPPYCAITSSSLDAIPIGSKIVYLDPAGLGTAAGGAVVGTTRRSAHASSAGTRCTASSPGEQGSSPGSTPASRSRSPTRGSRPSCGIG